MEEYHDLGRRVASLETDMRVLREEVHLNRVRYHDLSNKVAPILMEGTDIDRHEKELRELRAALDNLKGVWKAITIVATVLATVIGGLWALADHFKLF